MRGRDASGVRRRDRALKRRRENLLRLAPVPLTLSVAPGARAADAPACRSARLLIADWASRGGLRLGLLAGTRVRARSRSGVGNHATSRLQPNLDFASDLGSAATHRDGPTRACLDSEAPAGRLYARHARWAAAWPQSLEETRRKSGARGIFAAWVAADRRGARVSGLRSVAAPLPCTAAGRKGSDAPIAVAEPPAAGLPNLEPPRPARWACDAPRVR